MVVRDAARAEQLAEGLGPQEVALDLVLQVLLPVEADRAGDVRLGVESGVLVDLDDADRVVVEVVLNPLGVYKYVLRVIRHRQHLRQQNSGISVEISNISFAALAVPLTLPRGQPRRRVCSRTMEATPLRPVPARPAAPVEPALALQHVGERLPRLAPAERDALALVGLAGWSRADAAAQLGIAPAELARRLAVGAQGAAADARAAARRRSLRARRAADLGPLGRRARLPRRGAARRPPALVRSLRHPRAAAAPGARPARHEPGSTAAAGRAGGPAAAAGGRRARRSGRARPRSGASSSGSGTCSGHSRRWPWCSSRCSAPPAWTNGRVSTSPKWGTSEAQVPGVCPSRRHPCGKAPGGHRHPRRLSSGP